MSTKLDVKKIYLAPAVASIFMGIVAWGSYQIFDHLIHMNSVSVVLAILLAVIFYAAAILAVGGYTKEEILAKGNPDPEACGEVTSGARVEKG